MLRRLFVVLAGLLVPLAALPSLAATHIIVAYQFAVNGSMPEDLGKQVGDKIASEIAALGGVQVIHGAAAAKPADYRAAARAAGADFYFTGSILPVFSRYSAIEQLVSTRTGTVVWSISFQFAAVADIAGEGARVRDELLRGDPTPPPGIAANGDSLVTPIPMSGFAILPITGSALAGDRAFAVKTIAETLQRAGFRAVTLTSDTPIDPAVDGISACTTTGARTLVAGTLDTTRVDTGTAAQTTAHIALRRYDCRSHNFDQQATVVNHIAPIASDAISGAIQDAVSAFPAPS